jgi:hypothetical protein
MSFLKLGNDLDAPGTFQTPALNTVPTILKLHLLCKHTIHGTITGLAPIRTMASVDDGLDRLLVSLKDAKVCMSGLHAPIAKRLTCVLLLLADGYAGMVARGVSNGVTAHV